MYRQVCADKSMDFPSRVYFFYSDVKSEHEVLEYLKNGTLVGLLPVPHPILIRKYQASESTELWFHTYVWGVIYVR